MAKEPRSYWGGGEVETSEGALAHHSVDLGCLASVLQAELRDALVELQQSAKSFAALDWLVLVRRLGHRNDELVVEALVVPLMFVVLDELADSPAEVAFAERHDVVQALGFDREHKPLCVRVQGGSQMHPVVLMRCEVSTFGTRSILSMGAGLSWSRTGTTGLKNGSTAMTTVAVSGASRPLGQV